MKLKLFVSTLTSLVLSGLTLFSAELFPLSHGWGVSLSASTSPKYINIEQGEGLDLVSNGTFANTNGWVLGSNWAVSGNTAIFTTTNLMSNGAFASTNGWLVSGDWSVATGVGKFITTTTSKTSMTNNLINVTSGTVYSLQYTISSMGGTVTIAPAFGNVTGTVRSANGTYLETITPLASGSNFYFIGSSTDAATGYVDNVSMRVASMVETSTITQAISTGVTAGTTYRIYYTVSGIDAGTNTLEVLLGTDSGGVVASDTIYTPSGYVDIKSSSTSSLVFRAVATNISTFAISAVGLRQAPKPSYANELQLKVSTATDLPVYIGYNEDSDDFTNHYAVSRAIMVNSNSISYPVIIKNTKGISKLWYRSSSGTPTLDVVGY